MVIRELCYKEECLHQMTRRSFSLYGYKTIIGLPVVLGAVLWILAGFFIRAQPVQLSIGVGDASFFDGFHAAEPLQAAFAWSVGRWSAAESTIKVPTVTGGWQLAELVISNQYPDATVVTPHLRWQSHYRVPLTLVAGDVRRVQFLFGQHPWWSWATPLVLESSTRTIGTDPRDLGVLLLEVSSRPTLLATGLRGYWWLSLSLLGVGVAVLGSLLRLAPRHGILAMVVAMVVVSGLTIRHPHEMWPYLHWWVTWVWLQVGTMAAVYAFGWVTGSHTLLGHTLPLLLVWMWWLLPVVQLLLLHEGQPLAQRDVQTTALGSMGIIGSWIGLACVGWWYRRRHASAPWVWQEWGMLAVAVTVSLWQLVDQFPVLFRYGSGDFQIWIDAARNWVYNGVLYRLENVAANPFALYKRPPFYIMWFTPFVDWQPLDLLNAYRWLNLALLIGISGLWMSLVAPVQRWWWLAVVVISLNAQPLFDTISLGQTDIVLLFAFTLIYWSVQRGHDWLAGVMIAMMASFKIYPIILLVFFVIKRRWWVLWGCLLGMLAWNGVAIAVMGWELHVLYVTKIFFSIGGTTAWLENQTIAGFLARFVDDMNNMHLLKNPVISRLSSLIAMALASVVAWLALRDYPATDSRFGVQYGLFLVLMVIAIPVAWMHYATILWIVLMVMVQHFRIHHASVVHAWAWALSMAIILFGNQRSFNYKYDLGVVSLMLSSYKLYAIVLLTAVMMHIVWSGSVSWAHAWRQDGARWCRIIGWPRLAGWLERVGGA